MATPTRDPRFGATAQLSPSPSTNANSAIATKPLSETQLDIAASFDEHIKSRQRIDEVLCLLKSADKEMMKSLRSHAEYKAIAECKVIELQRMDDEVRAEVQAKKTELLVLQQSLEEKANHIAMLERQLTSTQATTSLSADLEKSQDVVELETSEAKLRQVEDTLLGLLDQKEVKERRYEDLIREYEALTHQSRAVYSGVESEIRQHQQDSLTLAEEVHTLQKKRDTLALQVQTITEQSGGLQQKFEELKSIKEDLEPALRQAKESRRAAEVELSLHLDDLARASRQTKFRSEKLEEAMMLLKAYVIDFSTDYEFIGAVMEKERVFQQQTYGSNIPYGMRGFESAWDLVRTYVCRIAGPQVDNERWRLSDTFSVQLSDVENILSALKQMVVCFDMLDSVGKSQLTMSVEIIRNTVALRAMGQESVVKYGELLRMREQQKVAADNAKEQKRKANAVKQRMQVQQYQNAMYGGGGGGVQQQQQPQQQYSNLYNRSRSASPVPPVVRVIF